MIFCIFFAWFIGIVCGGYYDDMSLPDFEEIDVEISQSDLNKVSCFFFFFFFSAAACCCNKHRSTLVGLPIALRFQCKKQNKKKHLLSFPLNSLPASLLYVVLNTSMPLLKFVSSFILQFVIFFLFSIANVSFSFTVRPVPVIPKRTTVSSLTKTTRPKSKCSITKTIRKRRKFDGWFFMAHGLMVHVSCVCVCVCNDLFFFNFCCFFENEKRNKNETK